MVLPQTFPATPDGSEKAIRIFVESYGRVAAEMARQGVVTPALQEVVDRCERLALEVV